MTEIIEEVVEKDKEDRDRYIIKLTYSDKSNEEIQVVTKDIEYSIQQIQRNREPFTYEVMYVYKGDGL